MTVSEFKKIYWDYYISLENDFINTEKYVALDEDNKKTFSIEYMKIFQMVCAEIDVFSKVFCSIIDANFNKETIAHYCKVLTTEYADFTKDRVHIIPLNKDITPWDSWSWQENQNTQGKISVTGNSPQWWSEHNKVKHSRTLFTSSGFNFKKANQKNVIYSLAALFQLEMYLYRKLTTYDKVETKPSQLFKMTDWEEVVISLNNGYATLSD